MSPKSNKSSSIWRWAVALLLVGAGVGLWSNRQLVVDTAVSSSFTPSQQISSIAERAQLGDKGRFYFYASRPELEAGKDFNTNCQRKEAKSPILGCYDGSQIYLFDVTDKRLDGIEEVTAAHEMLHAAYDRLSSNEKERINTLLQKAYDRLKNPELAMRMAYYDRSEPGEFSNELHSILPTEFSNLGAELEAYYQPYFSDRNKLVSLHATVEQQFNILSSKADSLVKQIENLASSINNATENYNQASEQLNRDIQSFNVRATQTGGYSSQAEFESDRNALSSRSNELAATRQQIEANITTYKSLVAKLDALNTEAASLNRSLDSTLTPAPAL